MTKNKDQRAWDTAFAQQQPNHHQKAMAQNLCRTKYEEEVAREELHFLKQQMTSDQSCWTAPFEDKQVLVQDQYGDIGRRAREKMLVLSVKCAEAQYARCHQQHNDQVQHMWQEQRSAPMHLRLSQAMMDLIEQRFHQIEQRVERRPL